MAFDGIVTKTIGIELQKLIGGRIDKILHPLRNTLHIGIYSNRVNYLLNICIDSSNYRVNITNYPKPNPKIATNFCMVLRKHLQGLFLKNVITSNFERILTFEFEGFDDIDDIISKKLIIELMGKHCNIILVNENGIIIDSLRHIISSDRDITPHSRYILPKSTKLNILDCTNFDEFYNHLDTSLNLAKSISNTFTGISKSFIDFHIENLNINTNLIEDIRKLYNYIIQILSAQNTSDLYFTGYDKGYTLTLNDEDSIDNKNDKDINNELHLNTFLDDFYFDKEKNEEFKNLKDKNIKIVSNTLKKHQKRLLNINEKLDECKNMDTYKLYGELLTANLYTIKNLSYNLSEIALNNYYDNNEEITIKLDKKYSPSINAKIFFKKYSKLKNALEIVSVQKEETLNEINYLESILFSLDNSSSVDDINEIEVEISENLIFRNTSNILKNENKNSKYGKKANKKSNNKNPISKSNSVTSFNPIKYQVDSFTLLVGRNNKENDYLTLKYASKNSLWFHTKDIHGSHCILQVENNNLPSDDVLIKCAKIAKEHSKAKYSSNTPVDMCEVKYVKKPKNTKPGMVIYSNNKTFYV